MKRKSTEVLICSLPALPGDLGTAPCDILAQPDGEAVIRFVMASAARWTPAVAQPTSIQPVLLRVDSVEDKPMEFLLENRLPRRMLTGVCGFPSVGKSWFIYKAAADGSKGIDTFTGKRIKPFNTLIWTNEALPETIRRRLTAMGADLKRIFILTGAQDAQGKPVSLTLENVAEIEAAVKATNAELLLVDPLQSFLGSKTDMNQANHTRPLLDNISGIADRSRLAVIIVRHLAKAGSTHAIGRALGSIDITAKFRTEYLIGEAPDGSHTQVIAHLKPGELQRQESMRFAIEGKNEAAHLVWKGRTTLSAQELLTPEKTGTRKPRDVAKDYLIDALADGPRDPKELESGVTIPRATLHRAANELGVVMTGDKKGGRRLWTLPEPKWSKNQRRDTSTTTEDDDTD